MSRAPQFPIQIIYNTFSLCQKSTRKHTIMRTDIVASTLFSTSLNRTQVVFCDSFSTDWLAGTKVHENNWKTQKWLLIKNWQINNLNNPETWWGQSFSYLHSTSGESKISTNQTSLVASCYVTALPQSCKQHSTRVFDHYELVRRFLFLCLWWKTFTKKLHRNQHKNR